jgi:hypothetical protein
MRLIVAIALVFALGCGATSPRGNGHDAATNAGAAGAAGSIPANDGPATSDAAGHAALNVDAGIEIAANGDGAPCFEVSPFATCVAGSNGACSESGPATPLTCVGGAWSCPPGYIPSFECTSTRDPLPPPPDAAPSADASAGDGGVAPWPAVADYGAPGPFTVARDTNTGPGGAYDVFRPAMLGGANRRNPIVSWANGTLFSLADYQKLLEHWASHGLVVIAGHTNTTAGGGTHKAAIDWLIAENARAGSPYFGLLDTMHVAAAGHSQGGGATIAAGAQKPGPLALTTTLPLMPILSFESDTSIVGKQTAPMFNINATMDTRDPTGAVAMQIYTAAKTELVQAAFIGIHEDAWMSSAMFAPTLAWFRLRLMGDAQARPLFYPAGTCGLCRDPAWKQVRYQNVP